MPVFTDVLAMVNRTASFRRELATSEHSQALLMMLQGDRDLGEETLGSDQTLFIIAGEGEAVLDGERSPIAENSLVVAEKGARLNIINTGNRPLRFVVVCAPPAWEKGTLHQENERSARAWLRW